MSDQPPFRFTPQVGIILAVAVLALAMPIALVGLYFREAPEPAPSAEPADTSGMSAPMERTLEALADSQLAGSRITLQTDEIIRITTEESVRHRSDQMVAAVEAAGGTALETTAQAGEGTTQWMITIPNSHRQEFLASLEVPEMDPAIANPDTSDGGTDFLRVEIISKAPKP